MILQLLNSHHFWQTATNLGTSQLLLPIMIIAVTILWYNNQHLSAYKWFVGLILVISITAISKIIFFGWGVGIESLDFIGVSGHTLLASSILPLSMLAFLSITGHFKSAVSYLGLFFGVVLSIYVGISRVVINAHSMSEVVVGWIFGFTMSAVVLRCIQLNQTSQKNRPPTALFIFVTLCCVLLINMPSTNKLSEFSATLAGHTKPYARWHKLSNN